MFLIKIGGGASIALEAIADDIAGLGEPVIIVHGANALRDEVHRARGCSKEVVTSVSGYSSVLTDDAMIDSILMTYAGLRNKRIVELLQMRGVNAIGLTGLDGRLVSAKRTKGIRVKEGEKTKILRDLTGKPEALNVPLLTYLIENGYTPVLSVPFVDESGHAVNSENDDLLPLIHRAFQAERIISLIEGAGFLRDKDDPTSCIPTIDAASLEEMEQTVAGRMKRKVLAMRRLFEAGPTTVHLCDGRVDSPITRALRGEGTVILGGGL